MGILNTLKEKVTQYVDVYVKLVKVNFIGRTANLFSYMIFAMIVMFIVFCILILSGMWLAEVFMVAGLSKMVAFLITVGVYLLLLLIILACRKPITRFFASGVIRVMTEGDEEDKEGL